MRLPPSLTLRLLPAVLAGAFVFANATADAGLTLISEPIALANAQPEDGWYLAAPYGDVKHKGPGGVDVIQRFTFANAKTVVSDFKGLLARVLDLRFGKADLPVYYGHPDDVGWAMSNASADNTVYNRVQDLEARPDGLWAKLNTWDADFSKLPKGLGISPRWIALPNASEPNVFEPVKLISIGLWTTPKIPGTSLVNGDLDPVATPTPEAPVERRFSDPEKLNLTNENVALKSQIAALNSTIATISGERDEWKSRSERASREADAKWTEANAFKAAMASLLAREYVSFRNAITPAEEPALVASLVNAANPDALDAILVPLRAKAVSLPNAHSAATKLGDRQANPDAGAAQADFKGKVNQIMGSGLSYGDAWTAAQKANPDLFKSAYPNG